MENIKSVVRNEEWQRLRVSLKAKPISFRLSKLQSYLDNSKNERKLRRVHNYLAAMRGIHNPRIKEMRDKVKRKRERLGYTSFS